MKSVKGTEFPACFDVSVTQEEFDRWMEVFYKYRGSLITGGISSYSMIPAGYRSPVAKAGFSASAFSLLTSFLSPGASLISPAEVAA